VPFLCFLLIHCDCLTSNSSAFGLWIDLNNSDYLFSTGNFDYSNDFECVINRTSKNDFQSYTMNALGGGGIQTLAYIQSHNTMTFTFAYKGNPTFPTDKYGISDVTIYWFTDNLKWQTPVSAVFTPTSFGISCSAKLYVDYVNYEAQIFIKISYTNQSNIWLYNNTATTSSIKMLSISSETKEILFSYNPQKLLPPTVSGPLYNIDTILLVYSFQRLLQLGCSGKVFSISYSTFKNSDKQTVLILRNSAELQGLSSLFLIPPNAVSITLEIVGCSWYDTSVHDGPYSFNITKSPLVT